MSVGTYLDRFRQPEYTGENRCIPCTVVNAVIAAIVAPVAGMIGWWAAGLAVALLAGGGVLAGSAVAIYLRGYLVPGTPWLTKRYLPDRVLRWFDKSTAEHLTAAFDAEALLKDAGVVRECDEVDDLCLTDGFDAEWRERMVERRDEAVSRGDLARLLGVDLHDLEIEDHDGAVLARYEGRRIGQWESDGAYIADMAAASSLRERVGDWDGIRLMDRASLLTGLRAFIDRCPVCDGPVTMDEEVVESCCRSIDVVAVSCSACDRRLLEAEQPG